MREGGLGLAEAARDWRLEVTPDFDAQYRLVVPFPDAEGAAARVADEWQGHARVTEGRAAMSFLESGDVVEIVGQGPLVAQARYLFHAPAPQRTDLSGYLAPGAPLLLETDAANATATVRWVATASNEGAPCATREVEMVVRAGEPVALPGERALWPDAACPDG